MLLLTYEHSSPMRSVISKLSKAKDSTHLPRKRPETSASGAARGSHPAPGPQLGTITAAAEACAWGWAAN